MFCVQFTTRCRSEKKIMAALNDILAKISEVQAGAEAEKAQVAQALADIQATVDALRVQLEQAINNQVDVNIVNDALDKLKSSVDSIYTPPAE